MDNFFSIEFEEIKKMSAKKTTTEEEEDTATSGHHGHPLLIKTDMSEEMAFDVSCITYFNSYIFVINYIF